MALTVDKEGFTPSDVIIESGAEELNIGVIWLSSGRMLEELTVEGRVDTDARGRTIIYPGQADVKASPTAVSLFQKLPLSGLTADPINRSISVQGHTPVILIDGVPSSLTELLAISPKNIEKIEYSILPPARYASKSEMGYLSVTLKARTDGGQVDLWARSALTTCFFDASLMGSYHNGHSKFQVNFTPSWRNYQNVNDHVEESYIGTDGFRLDLESQGISPFNYFSAPVQLKYTFAPNQGTVFSAALNLRPYSDHQRSDGYTLDFLHNDYNFDNENRSKDFATSLDLYFRRDFNSSNSLEAEVVGTLSNSDYDRENIYNYISGVTETYPIDIHSNRRSLITELSYIHSFSQQSELTAGYSNTLSRSENTYRTTDYQPELTENNNYLYVAYGYLLNRVYLQARTGAKLYWMRNDDSRHHYFRNISALEMQWVPVQAFSLTASANYSSGIPGLTSLTDYAQQVTPYLISNGNPNLKTQHYINVAARPTWRYKKLAMMGGVFYSKTINGVFTDVSYLGNGMFLSQSINARRSDTWTGMLQLQMSDLHGFGFNVRGVYSHYTSEGADWKEALASWSGLINVWYNLRKFTFSYYYVLPGKSLYGQKVSKGENSNALQVSYAPDKHWNIQASWMYMFDGHGTKYPSWNYSAVNPSYVDRNIRDNGNMVCISVNYTADFGSIFRTKRRTLNNSDGGSAILKL